MQKTSNGDLDEILPIRADNSVFYDNFISRFFLGYRIFKKFRGNLV